MKRLTLLAFIAALAPQAVFADDAPAAPVVDTLTPHSCKQPDLGGTQMTKDLGNHDKKAEFDAYQTCMKDYIHNQQALQQMHFQLASKALKEFNDFIVEWNDYVNRPH